MSTDLTPTMVATAIGKKTMSAQMMTLDRSPVPNQSAIKGASARIGRRLRRHQVGGEQPLGEPRASQRVARQQREA